MGVGDIENDSDRGMFDEIKINGRLLMGPGPSNVNPRVWRAMSTPLMGHIDPDFLMVMDDIKAMTQKTYQTQNASTFVVAGLGSAGMETCFVNLLEPGDEAVICINGVFGSRMVDIAERCGAKVIKVEAEWGKVIDPGQVESAIKNSSPKLVAIVHAETSTGVLQPLEEIGRLVKNVGSLFVVDAVTSYCGTSIKIDQWGIDAIYSGSQKCLSAPPGLSPVSFGTEAVNVLKNRSTKVQSWYLDLTMLETYWSGKQRAYHHTAPISAMYAIREALRIVLEEGMENRFVRHQKHHKLLRNGLEALGIEFLVDGKFRLPMLNAVKIPNGVDDKEVRKRLLHEYHIEIGGGLGPLAGKIWRIGLMGESSTINNVNSLLSALSSILKG